MSGMVDPTPTVDAPSKPHQRFRRTRITASLFFAVLTVTLCMLWVRSFHWDDAITRMAPNLQVIASEYGDLVFLDDHDTWGSKRPWRYRSEKIDEPQYMAWWMGTRVSHLYPAAFFAALAIMTFPYSARFSLRAMLIATTLAAVVLGLGVWAAT